MSGLDANQRRTVVQETIHRLAEQKRHRKGTEHSISTETTFASNSLLVYKDPATEEQFMRFIHNTPNGAVLLMLSVSTLTVVIELLTFDGINPLLFLPFIVVINAVEVYIHIAARRLEEGNRLHKLLKTERVLFSILVLLVALGAVLANFSLMNDCSRSQWVAVGSQPKAYKEGYCRNFTALQTIAVGLLAAIRIISFSVLVGLSAILSLFTAIIWLVPGYRPEHDTAQTVLISNILVLATCGFLCFIRYVDEKQQRRHFEAQEQLMTSAEVLTKKRVATLERFLSVLPRTVSDRLRGGRWKRSHIDITSDATVLVTKIHHFDTWSTSRVPIRVAAIVALMQSTVDDVLRRGRLDRVGRLGDTTVAVGNLLSRNEGNVAAMTVEVSKQLANLELHLTEETPPLVAAVHMGEAEGVLQGNHYVRYEVRGSAVDATRRAVMMCSDEGRLLASTVALASTLSDPDAWCKDAEMLSVEVGDSPVTFRRIDEDKKIQEDPSYVMIYPNEGSSTAAMRAAEDGMLVTGISKLLGGSGPPISEGKDSSTATQQQSYTTTSIHLESEPAMHAPLDITTDLFGFHRFTNESEQEQFRELQMKDVPRQAAKIWLGYAGFVALTTLALIVDLLGPHAANGAVILVLTVLCSVAMALVPSVLNDKRMATFHAPWTVVGMFVPLLTVFGAALSRPSMVGLDVRGYVALGAFMRSYCFNDARQQAMGVPLFALLGSLHYLVPGAHENLTYIGPVAILILATVLAARNREGAEMRNHRRGVIAEAVLGQIKEVTRVQFGLLRSTMPRCVFDAAVADNFEGTSHVHQVPAVVMIIRAAAPLRSIPTPSHYVASGSGLEVVLDWVLSTVQLSTAGVLGDDAMVVGPLPTTEFDQDYAEKEEMAFHEAFELGLAVTHGDNAPAMSVLLDHDTVAHVLELGPRPNYSLLGTSAIRLMGISAHVSGNVKGLLVSDRAAAMVRSAEMLQKVDVEMQAPMMIRGLGVLRWKKVRKA